MKRDSKTLFNGARVPRLPRILTQKCRSERLAGGVRVADLHVSHLSRENRNLLTRATEERAKTNIFRTRSSQRVPLGGGSCLFAEPDIHLLSPAPKGLLRRLSLCSLPVPKQFEGASEACAPSLSRPLAGPGSLRAV